MFAYIVSLTVVKTVGEKTNFAHSHLKGAAVRK